ncbi:MAG: pitrilysin family protein, partial [Candidatus Acidoferrales bacterium]
IVSTDVRGVRQETLANGLTILTEQMPHVRSVAVGIWVKSGSRIEPPGLTGISHFIEHMVFKGTERRTAEQIAREADSVGGQLDAFTAKEMVCFNARVIDEHLPRIFDVLSDLVLAPVFRAPDIEKERAVVLEEINMEEDNADYLVHEIFSENFWYDHPIGRPILGMKQTLAGFHRELLFDFFRRWYVPNQMLITAAGQLEHERFITLLSDRFRGLPAHQEGILDPVPQPHARISTRSKRDLEQMHLCLGVPCYPLPHQKRYAVILLNSILGGGMSSRLFQTVREREGLAYAVFSDVNAYRDTGCLSVYAGTARETLHQALRLILAQFTRLKQELVSADELRAAKENLKGGLMLSLESTAARMSRLAREEIYFGRSFSLDEILAAIEGVTPEDLLAIAREFFQPHLMGATLLGPLDGFQLSRDDLAC